MKPKGRGWSPLCLDSGLGYDFKSRSGNVSPGLWI
jgi:hypothetical protein